MVNVRMLDASISFVEQCVAVGAKNTITILQSSLNHKMPNIYIYL